MEDTLKLRLLSTDEVATIREKCLLLLSQMGMKIDHAAALNHQRGLAAKVVAGLRGVGMGIGRGVEDKGSAQAGSVSGSLWQ